MSDDQDHFAVEAEPTAPSLADHLIFRDRTETDTPFIMNSWLKSYKMAKAVRDMAPPTYYAFQHNRIEKCLANSYVAIASDPNDQDEMLGYIVYEVDRILKSIIVHWTYVKQPFRSLGIATALLKLARTSPHARVMYSHEPKKSKANHALIRSVHAQSNTYLAR